ncbi:MAG: hypothetical protein MK172_07265 [Verrucomicrobiales bacterium]|nr:hypothetical protein [Verrucomicrobiales bacterium]
MIFSNSQFVVKHTVTGNFAGSFPIPPTNRKQTNMKKPEIIDETVAQEFMKSSDAFHFTKAKEISDEAAESLSTYKGMLLLNGLTELSDTALKNLSRHKDSMFVEGKVSRLLGQSLGAEVSNFRCFGKIHVIRIVQERLSQFFVDDAHGMTLPTSVVDEQGRKGE